MTQEFRILVDQHRHRVYTFAYYSLGNREEAEDVTQEVLVRLWKNREELNTATLGAWIRRVTRNACIDAVRRRRAYRTRVVATGDGEDSLSGVSAEPAPDRAVETSELRATIRSALSSLHEPYRSIVILREIQDMKYEQISESLELPLNTVKSYLHRGRRMLRDKLGGTLDHESF
ncbi:MAG: RNA polymerase sigma factor [Candidatus Krumholzibacteriia bacterium]